MGGLADGRSLGMPKLAARVSGFTAATWGTGVLLPGFLPFVLSLYRGQWMCELRGSQDSALCPHCHKLMGLNGAVTVEERQEPSFIPPGCGEKARQGTERAGVGRAGSSGSGAAWPCGAGRGKPVLHLVVGEALSS